MTPSMGPAREQFTPSCGALLAYAASLHGLVALNDACLTGRSAAVSHQAPFRAIMAPSPIAWRRALVVRERKGLVPVLPDLVHIAGGTFVMGNNVGRPDERPAHAVALPSFRAGRRPVSNREYAVFVAATGREPPPFLADPRFAAPEQPVAGVSWFDAFDYCRWLAAETGLPLRLPTEAEREYASLGGLQGVDWPWGNEPPGSRPELAAIAVLEQPHVPGQVCANGYGLLCMADNLHEWCSDWYDPAYYASSPGYDPRGPVAGRRRASRGGSWRHMVKFNRLSSRSSLDPSYRYNDYGFRIYADGE